MNQLSISYQKHVKQRQQDADAIIAELGLPGLVYGTGSSTIYFQDDRSMPFCPFHQFAHWVPLASPDHALVIRTGHKPKLLLYSPKDFWHDRIDIEGEFWLPEFDIATFLSKEALWQELQSFKGYSYLGPEPQKAGEAGLVSASDELEHQLNWQRVYKSDYEMICLDMANAKAAKGHLAAQQRFLSGGSELDIHLSYLQAIHQTDNDLPYSAIVGLDDKAAVLHYENKRSQVSHGKVLLIDSGAKINGYGSDITRTHTSPHAPQEFVDLIAAMNTSQLLLCSQATPGKNFAMIHYESHLALAQILLDHQLVTSGSVESVVDDGLTKAFYPHGIGHLLGIFVHDVGGKQQNRQGTPFAADERYPTLRNRRTLEPGFVFTIEPGLYFIDFLLQSLREGSMSSRVNWPLVDRLAPCGGIRIEDNIALKASGVQNLTRPYLP